MTLYTSMPLEVVLDGFNSKEPNVYEVWVEGIHMQVEPLAPGIGRLVRLLQCELNDYLNPQLSPGAVIHYGKEQSAE